VDQTFCIRPRGALIGRSGALHSSSEFYWTDDLEFDESKVEQQAG
jgi:hypothetical protein